MDFLECLEKRSELGLGNVLFGISDAGSVKNCFLESFFSKENEYSYIFVFAFDNNDRVIERKVLNLNQLQKNKMSNMKTENNIIKRGFLEKVFGGVGTQKVPNTN